jgi:thioredoxin-like negative regulator of GroEL
MDSASGIKKMLETNSDYILVGIVIVILLVLFLYYNNTSYTNNAPSNHEPYSNQSADTNNGGENEQQHPMTNDRAHQDNSTKLMLFYTDWCGYSRQFLPVWEECKKTFAVKYPNLNIVDVECSNNDARCQGVQGFPTVKFYKDGHAEEFSGPRTVQGIEQFIAGRV